MLFNGLQPGGPRLLFKGGTSLSKAFGLITRFSEDIDITVFRDDLRHAAEVADLNALSGKKRRARLDAIRAACQAYIAGQLMAQLAHLAATAITDGRNQLELDTDDKDGQTLLFWYPAITGADGGYIRSAVKIEVGAKSELNPLSPPSSRPMSPRTCRTWPSPSPTWSPYNRNALSGTMSSSCTACGNDITVGESFGTADSASRATAMKCISWNKCRWR